MLRLENPFQKGIPMSTICRSDNDMIADVNLLSAQTELRDKLQQINPAVSFYRELSEGWYRRLSYAKSALTQIPLTDKRNQEILNELVSVATRETAAALKSYQGLDEIRMELEGKIQDLDLLALKAKSIPEFASTNFDIKDIRRLLHASEALLELRDSSKKEVSS